MTVFTNPSPQARNVLLVRLVIIYCIGALSQSMPLHRRVIHVGEYFNLYEIVYSDVLDS